MKRVLALILVCALASVSVTGHPVPAVTAAGEVLYMEIPQDSYCRAPATTVYLPIMLGNLSTDSSMLIRLVEVLDAQGKIVATEQTQFKLESLAGKAGSSDDIRTALGIIPPAPADIITARNLIAQATSTGDSKQKSFLIEQAFFASRAKQSMKNPEELAAEEAKIQQLLKTVTLAVDLPQFTTATASETAVPVTVRITGESAGQPVTVEQQTTVFLLASLPNGGMWHPGDGHVHTDGSAYKNYIPSQYVPGREDLYGYSDAVDGASVWIRRDQANSKGMQWIVITDHAGTAARCPTQARLDPNDEWLVYKQACQLATTQYTPTVTVCPGEELATKELNESGDVTGHLLSYANSSYAASYGSGTCQSLINNVIGAGGFGVVAHPYKNALGIGIPWNDWNAVPWNGLEIMSNESSPNTSAIAKWDQQLLSKLGDEVLGNYWCVAMANSDVHTSSSAGWGANMNYIYTGSYSAPGTSPTVVWDAIRNGRSTASSDGSFAAATVNGVYPGSHMTVVRNSTVSVFVTGTPLSTKGYTNAQVKVIKNNTIAATQNVALDGISNFATAIPLTISQNCYIRVEIVYSNGLQSGYCLVNPVFIGTSN